MQTSGPADTEMSRATPEPTLGCGLPISAPQDQGSVRPGMVMQMIRIALEEFVDEDVEREPLPVLQEQIVAFQIGFVVLAIHDHTVSAEALEEFF